MAAYPCVGTSSGKPEQRDVNIMSDRISEVLLKYTTDKTSLAETMRSSTAVTDELLQIAKSAVVVASETADVTAVFEKLTTAQQQLKQSSNGVVFDLSKFQKQQAEAALAASETTTALKKEAAAAADLSGKIGGGGGDIIGRGDTLASALGTLGGTMDFAGAEALSASSDVLAVIDALKAFRAATVATEVTSGAAAAGTTSVAGGLAAMATAAAPLVIAVLAIAAPLVAIKRLFDNANNSAQRAAEAISRQVEINRRVFALQTDIREMEIAQISARRQAIADEQDQLNTEIMRLQENLDAISRDFWDHLVGNIRTTSAEAQTDELNKQISELTGQFNDLGVEMGQLAGPAATYAQSLSDARQAITEMERLAFAPRRAEDIAAGSNTEEINREIEAISEERAIREGIITTLIAQNTTLQQNLSNLENGSDAYEQMAAQIAANNEAIVRNQNEMSDLNLVYSDYTDALPLVQKTGSAAIEAVLAAIQLERERAEFLKTISAETLDTAIADTEQEMRLLNQQRAALEALVTDYSNIPENLQDALSDVDGSLAQTAANLDFLRDATTRAAATENESSRMRSAAMAQTEAQAKKMADARAALNKKDTEDAKKLADDRARINDDLKKRLSEIDKNGIAKQAELQDKFRSINADSDADRVKAIEKFNYDITQIEIKKRQAEQLAARNHARNIEESILSRNVDLFVAEQQKYTDEKAQLTDAAQEREIALSSELAAIEKQRQEQLTANRQAITDLQKRLADERNEAQISASERLSDAQRASAAGRAERAAAFNEELASTKTHLEQMSRMRQDVFLSEVNLIRNIGIGSTVAARPAALTPSVPVAPVQQMPVAPVMKNFINSDSKFSLMINSPGQITGSMATWAAEQARIRDATATKIYRMVR